MFNWIKNLFKKKDEDEVSFISESKPNNEINELKSKLFQKIIPLDKTKIIDIGTVDKCYQYYLMEIDNGAVQYRVVEDTKWNTIHDMDDLEDHYCMLKIQIKYADGKIFDRYRLLGEITRTHSYMNNLNKKYSKEEIEKYINYLKQPNF